MSTPRRSLGVARLGALALALLGVSVGCGRAERRWEPLPHERGIEIQDRFYLVDAEPEDPDYLRTLRTNKDLDLFSRTRLGYSGHRLKRGRGLVLVWRLYRDPLPGSIDDESYAKLTIWLPEGVPDALLELDLAKRGRAWVIHSEGGSAWPRTDCSGYVASGSVRVEPRGARYGVSVRGQFEPVEQGSVWPQDCVARLLEIEFEAESLAHEALTPWLGAPGADHPYDETYR